MTESIEKMDTEDNSDSASVTSDSDNESASDEKINSLEKQLSENEYLYDVHLELIKVLRKDAEFEKLQKARERMSKTFPLTEELWLEWLKDEQSCSDSNNPDDRERIYKLCERAVKDYLSVPVWLEYVQYAVGEMGRSGGAEKVRSVFEDAITSCGLHVAQGSNIWEAYREFECALLGGLQPDIGAVLSKEKQEVLDAQSARIMNLFKRQLSIPLLDMEQTWNEYEEMKEEDNPNISMAYKKSLAKLEKMKKFEISLSQSDPPKLDDYKTYIDFEIKEGDPARIQCIYERAVAHHCLIADLWIEYLKYLDEKLKIKSVILNAYERAVRNCPWNVDLWLRFMRALERHGSDKKQVTECFEKALLSGISQAGEFLQVWTAFIDYQRRKIDWEKDHNEELENLRKLLERAIEHLNQYFGKDGDPLDSLSQYWARLEAVNCKNMTKSRELWNEIMSHGHGNQANMWLERYNLERYFGDPKHCRKLLNQALNSVTDWPESITEAYMTFERENGTLEQYDSAAKKCFERLKRHHERQLEAQEKEKQKGGKHHDQKGGKRHDQKGGKHQSKEFVKAEPKRQQDSFAKPNLDPRSQTKKRKLEETKEDVFKMPQAKISKPPPGWKPSEEGAEPANKKVVPELSQEEIAAVTVFVSNLAYSVDEDDLRIPFCDCGEVSAIRLIKNAHGKSKGFAYIEFLNKESVAKALAMDRKLLGNRPMFISPFNKKANTGDSFQFKTGVEQHKLFIKNLPFVTTKEALTQVFGQYGEIKDVRMVTYRSGAPKGMAYIEYHNKEDANTALLKTDKMMIGDHSIEVAISNPPPKSASRESDDRNFSTSLGGGKSLGGGNPGVTPRGHARTQVMLVPRQLKTKPQQKDAKKAAKPISQTETNPSESQSVAKSKMSNDDFRKMLLNKK